MRLLTLLLFLAIGVPAQAAHIDTLAIPSKAMGRKLKATVAVPAGYAKGTRRYPVLYLLHGAYGNQTSWLTAPPTDKGIVARLADQYRIIIVMPMGDTMGYYVDSPLDRQNQFETYITQEVVKKIDATYRTIANCEGRVITGLSMGGHGALYLSSKHPELYCAAGSMSGAVDLNTRHWARDSTFRKKRRHTFERLLGPERDTADPFPAHSVVAQAARIKANALPLIFECGTADFLLGPNRELHRRLLANGTPHTYIERPGAHDWAYWENALPYHLLFFSKVLAEQRVGQKRK